MTPKPKKQSRREWLAGLKENDSVIVVRNGERLDGFVYTKRHDGLLGIYTKRHSVWISFELFRSRDGYLKGRCLCSPRPRIEPVEGGGK